MLEVPDELIDAAKIDGCKDFGIFTRIVVPIVQPALAAWASLTIIARWNDFFWPLLFLNKTRKYTLMVSVSMLPVSDGLATPWQVILAGTTLVILPSIVMYLCMQLFQKSENFAGAVKG
jgi:multiple sugar transport system permease protein